MQLDAKVEGVRSVREAMIDASRILSKDIHYIVPIAGKAATLEGRDITKPGERYRNVIRRKGTKLRNKKISDSTDTSRWATHWVVFLRQNKKPFYVPITPNPYGGDFDDKSGNREIKDYAKKDQDSARKQKENMSARSMYKYQQKRKSTLRDSRGRIKKYDSPSEIEKMRRIGRRGLAESSWSWMGNKIKGGGKRVVLKTTQKSVGKKSKDAINRQSEKWTNVIQRKGKSDHSIYLNNKLTYMKKVYPGIVGRIEKKAGERLVGLAKQKKRAAEDRMRKKMNKAA